LKTITVDEVLTTFTHRLRRKGEQPPGRYWNYRRHGASTTGRAPLLRGPVSTRGRRRQL